MELSKNEETVLFLMNMRMFSWRHFKQKVERGLGHAGLSAERLSYLVALSMLSRPD